ncbi:MAG: GAF domain-containing protein [Kangiellaceae bacterium]|nr:GAF domain-containing protein [Kangiellaceae bacterium]
MSEIDNNHCEQQLEVLSQFAVNLVNVTEKEQLYWLVAKDVVSKLSFVDCVIYELSVEKQCLIQKAASGIKNPYQYEIINRLEIPVGKGVTGSVALSGRSIIVSDASQESNYIVDIESNLSEIAVPIIYEGQIRGVIDCEDPHKDFFGQQHLRALTTVAAMLGSKLIQIDINTKLAVSNIELQEKIDYSKKVEKELEAHKVLLEQKVEQRTSDLQASIDELVTETHSKLEAEAELRDNQEMMHQSAKMASIGVLAAGVAHEINNPIAFIKSNLQSVREILEDLAPLRELYRLYFDRGELRTIDIAVQQKELEKIQFDDEPEELFEDLPEIISSSLDGTSRVIQIVSELKEFSHLDKETPKPENINELLDKAISLGTNELKYKANLKLNFTDLPEIECWGDKLVQVFLNLLINAAQAIDKRGDITIKTTRFDNELTIEITDTGKGMSAETKEKMFDPFFTTKSVGVGTGLGMHISYKIIENHQGRIRVESVLGKGTSIFIKLPIGKKRLAEKN